jgi:HD-GYP domain-containing protein (c-di-GMP phosphodiesterase class II)
MTQDTQLTGYVVNINASIDVSSPLFSSNETLKQCSLDEYLALIKARKYPDFSIIIVRKRLADEIAFKVTSDSHSYFPHRPFPIFMVIPDLTVHLYKLNRICLVFPDIEPLEYKLIISIFKLGIDLIDDNISNLPLYGKKIIKFYRNLKTITQTHSQVFSGASLTLQERLKAEIDLLQHIAELVETYDHYHVDHIRNMGRIAYNISIKSGFSEARAKDIATAVKLHDIGKIFIPKILLGHSVEASTEQELIIFHPHTRAGNIIAKRGITDPELKELISNVVFYHHENGDGSGYWGKTCKDTPFEARLTRVLDVYDSLQRKRPFRKHALSSAEVREYITSKSGVYFDPEIVKALFDKPQKLHLVHAHSRNTDIFSQS